MDETRKDAYAQGTGATDGVCTCGAAGTCADSGKFGELPSIRIAHLPSCAMSPQMDEGERRARLALESQAKVFTEKEELRALVEAAKSALGEILAPQPLQELDGAYRATFGWGRFSAHSLMLKIREVRKEYRKATEKINALHRELDARAMYPGLDRKELEQKILALQEQVYGYQEEEARLSGKLAGTEKVSKDWETRALKAEEEAKRLEGEAQNAEMWAKEHLFKAESLRAEVTRWSTRALDFERQVQNLKELEREIAEQQAAGIPVKAVDALRLLKADAERRRAQVSADGTSCNWSGASVPFAEILSRLDRLLALSERPTQAEDHNWSLTSGEGPLPGVEPSKDPQLRGKDRTDGQRIAEALERIAETLEVATHELNEKRDAAMKRLKRRVNDMDERIDLFEADLESLGSETEPSR
jgi:hypothetical protein